MRKVPTAAVLLNRFGQELNKVLYPFFIVMVIARNGSATRQEIWDEIFALTQGAFPCELDSHSRQMSRLEKTFQLIELVQKPRDATVARYRLTDKGQKLYSESLTKLIEPLKEMLSTS